MRQMTEPERGRAKLWATETCDCFNWEKTNPTNEKLHRFLGPVEFCWLPIFLAGCSVLWHIRDYEISNFISLGFSTGHTVGMLFCMLKNKPRYLPMISNPQIQN
jgi:hypothetical protein